MAPRVNAPTPPVAITPPPNNKLRFRLEGLLAFARYAISRVFRAAALPCHTVLGLIPLNTDVRPTPNS